MSCSRRSESLLQSIRIHTSENSDSPDLFPARDYLASYFPTVDVRIEPDPWKSLRAQSADRAAQMLSAARVKDPTKEKQDFVPMYGEVDYERRSLMGKVRIGGVVYDGRLLVEAFLGTTSDRPRTDCASILVTNRLVSTFSRDDLRHHLRTTVFGFPSLISLPGVVEAPARPKEYYLLRQRLEAEGAGPIAFEELKRSFSGRFIDHGDDGIVEVVKGLALQATLFHLTLDPFCDNADCRLFNAHWQEDLIRSQISSQGLCEKHSRSIEVLGAAPVIRW